MIPRGATIDATDKGGEAALHFVVSHPSPDVVTLLLDRGANIDAPDRIFRQTALHSAALSNRASIEATNGNGRTAGALYLAASYGHSKVVKVLLDMGARVHTTVGVRLPFIVQLQAAIERL